MKDKPGEGKHTYHDAAEHQKMESPGFAAHLEVLLEGEGIVHDHEYKEEDREQKRVLHLSPKASGYSKISVHLDNKSSVIGNPSVPQPIIPSRTDAGQTRDTCEIRPQYSKIFRQNLFSSHQSSVILQFLHRRAESS